MRLVAGVTGLAGTIVVATPTPGEVWSIISLASGLTALVTVAALIRRRELILSPLFLLSLQCILFFVIVPHLLSGLDRSFFPYAAVQNGAYLGSQAERLVLAFGILLLLPLGWLDLRQPASEGRPLPLGLIRLFTVLVVVGLVLWAASERGYGGEALQHFGRNWVAPLLASLLALVFFEALRGPASHPLLLALPALIGAVLVVSHAGRVGMTLAGVAFMAWLVVGRSPRRVRLMVMVAAIPVALGTLSLFGYLRDPGAAEREGLMSRYVRPMSEKLVNRQMWTGWCFSNVLAAHGDHSADGNPFYFVAGLVPRAVWPAKPSLSTGGGYGVRYCGMDGIQSPHHSASVTLLGEPLVEAGLGGLVVAVVVVMAGLVVFTAITLGAGRSGLAAMMALSPWLVDFDQSFAMYVANGVKMGLIQMPVWLIVWYVSHRRASSCAA